MFYGGAFDVAVIWGLPPPLLLLLGVYSVRLLTRTTSLQRGPLEAPIMRYVNIITGSASQVHNVISTYR